MKKLMLFLILIALLSNVNALIEPEKNIVSVAYDESFSVAVKVKNDSNEKALIHLSSFSSIKTDFSVNDFYLNAGEETVIALNILSYYYNSNTNIELRAEYNGITEYADLTVITGNSSGKVNLKYYKQNICRNGLDKLSLWIKNDSLITQKIKLSADSEVFLPSIYPELIELNAGQERFVELELYSNNSFPLKDYSVNVVLESENEITSREIFFELTECIEIEKGFRLIIPDSFLSIEKGETKKIYFSARNLSDKDNEISFAVKSDLITELQQTKTVLAEGETRRYWIEVKALKTDEAGKHKLELYAFNPFIEIKKIINVNVKKMHEVNAELLTDNLEIERGHSGVFSLLIENKGDYKEKIEINYFSEEEINVLFSENDFYLNEKTDKKIYFSINPLVNAELGEKEIEVKVNEKTILVNFSVIEEEKPLITSGVIELLSVPEKITLTEETEIKVLIKNISGEKIENTFFWIEGLPKGTAFESVSIKEINNEKTKEFTGKILLDEKAVKGSYSITLVFENSKFRQKKEIQLIILEQEKQEEKEIHENDFLAGLISFGSMEGIGLIVIALIILILLLNPGKQKEKWNIRGNKK